MWRNSGLPEQDGRADKHAPIALVELIATVALALSTLVAATAVSIGFARADTLVARADVEAAPLALLIALLLTAMGGLTALMAEHRPD
jgi:hypothetical protein